jgi:hypothetical protein
MDLPRADSPPGMTAPLPGDDGLQTQTLPVQDPDDAVNLSSPVDGAIPYGLSAPAMDKGVEAVGSEDTKPNGYSQPTDSIPKGYNVEPVAS